jgi:outer membrane protein assembly factor BamA
MRTLQYTKSSTDFSAVAAAEAKNSSLSFGGGYSQSSGWNANVTFTKKW